MDFTNKKIQNTYGGILNVGAAGVTGNTLYQVTDGFGTVLPIEISQSEVKFTGTVTGITGINGGGATGATGTGGVIALYGAFYDTTTQTNAGPAAANPFKYNSTDFSNGITIQNQSEIVFSSQGIFDIQFSAQFSKSDAGDDVVDVWLVKNGSVVSHSNTKLTLYGNEAKAVAAWNFLVSANAGDRYQIMWHSTDLNMSVLASPATTNPIRPAIPSIILTVAQLTYTQIGATGAAGAAGSSGTSGINGSSGSSGTSGINGANGSSGTSGVSGSSGTSGINGSSGTSGVNGVNGDRYSTTSTTSLTLISSGTISLVVGTGLAYTPAQSVVVAHDVIYYMNGEVIYYDPANGDLSVNVTSSSGSDIIFGYWTVNLVGAVGVNGSSGTSGINGANGSSGTSGVDGTNGSSGTSGVDGTNGSSGTSGIDGSSGTSGLNGSSGSSGTSGIDGSSGTSGVDGSSGSSGTSGVDGTNGSSGTSGVNGSSGSSGTSGFNGSSGSSGTSGTSGVDGTNGSSGSSGTSGVNGDTGPTGTQGPLGPTGATGDPGLISPSSISTNYTLTLTDQSKALVVSSASALTITIPPNSGTAFPTGANIMFIRGGTGEVSIAGGTGVSLLSVGSNKRLYSQYSSGSIIKTATDTWYLVGDLKA